MGSFSHWAQLPGEWRAWIGILSGIISLSAYVPYVRSIRRGVTRPSRTTWWILACVVFITLVTYRSSGAKETLWIVIGDLIGVLWVAILSIKHGEGGGEWVDFVSLVGAIFALALYLALSSPAIAMSALIVVDCLAMIPTWTKTYREPKSEDGFAWSLTMLGHMVGLLAVNSWVFAIVSYPIYHAIASGLVVLLTSRKV